MKKLTFLKPFLFSMCFIFILTSCSKEKQFERRLDGTWNISEFSSQSYEDGVQTDNFTWPNMGTITFDKDGTGSMSVLGASESFNWSATSTHIEIDSIGKMEIIKNEKTEQVWTQDETTVENGVTFRETFTMTLRKQD